MIGYRGCYRYVREPDLFALELRAARPRARGDAEPARDDPVRAHPLGARGVPRADRREPARPPARPAPLGHGRGAVGRLPDPRVRRARHRRRVDRLERPHPAHARRRPRLRDLRRAVRRVATPRCSTPSAASSPRPATRASRRRCAGRRRRTGPSSPSTSCASGITSISVNPDAVEPPAASSARPSDACSWRQRDHALARDVGLIELDGVSRRYEVGGGTVTALDDVDLDGRRRRVRGRARAVGERQDDAAQPDRRPRRPDRGRDRHRRQGRSRRAARQELFRFRRETVSFVFQTFNLFPGLTALENVQFGVDVAGRHRDAPSRRATCSARSASATGSTTSRTSSRAVSSSASPSPGALATGNPILLADEPTGELDFQTGVQILELLHEQAHAGITVLDRHPQPRDRACRRPGDRAQQRPRSSATARPPGGQVPDRPTALVTASRCRSGCDGRGVTCAPAGCRWRRSRSSSPSARASTRA